MLGRSRHGRSHLGGYPFLSETYVPQKEQIPGPAIAAQQIASKALGL